MANLLTIGRILLIIPFTALFFVAWRPAMIAALLIYVLAALTDLFDGMVARARGETSAVGAALDPLADKLLVAAAILLLTKNGVIAGPAILAALIILLREMLVAGLREALAGQGRALPVAPLAKWKTAAQMLATASLLAVAPSGLAGAAFIPIANGLLWIAAALTFWTGADYAAKAAGALRRGPDGSGGR